MIINIEITDEAGKQLDEIAKSEHRTRRAQATVLLQDVLEMLATDQVEQNHPAQNLVGA